MCAAEASVCVLKTEITDLHALQEGGNGRKVQGKYPEFVSPVTPVQLSCYHLLIAALLLAIVALSVALAVRKPEQVVLSPVYAACPGNWTGFGNKCFYFSEDTRNWTHSQASCKALGAELAQFENLEELNSLRRYMGSSNHWIGLHRESSQQPWKWTDSTDYNNLVSIRGVAECAYLNDNGISSARDYIDRKWICSKRKYLLQCRIPSTSL